MQRPFLAVLTLAASSVFGQELPPTLPLTELDHNKQPLHQLITTGWASWYGRQFHGRPTASGENYDMFALTAAHRTLPFYTLVRVSLTDSDSSVDVLINDRGPFVDDRIIDLSLGAARELGMVRIGIAQVELRVLHLPPPPRYILQIASFSIRENALALLRRLQGWGIPSMLEPFGETIRVIIEPAMENELPAIEQRLRAVGIRSWLRRTCSDTTTNDSSETTRRPCPSGV